MMAFHPAAVAEQYPDREALIFGEQRWTYAEVDQFSIRLAAMLAHDGLEQGDVVALLVSNRAEFLASAWAAQRSGLYYLPIPTRLTGSEIHYILEDSGAKALVVDPQYSVQANEAANELSLISYDLDDIAADLASSPTIDDYQSPPATEGGDMLYTSGTTGKPKGVRRLLSGEPLGSDAQRVKRGESLFGFSPETRFLSPAPLYHAAPLRFAMNLLRVGATVIGMPRFDAEGALKLIEQEKITHSQWVPTMFGRLLSLPDATRSRYYMSSLQVAIHAGAPCPPHVKKAMIDWWGPVLHEYYSGTESIGFTHITSQEWLDKPGSVGRPFGCTVHIVADNGKELAAGQTGHVYFEGKADLVYHNDREKTAAAHDDRGWATMGDIGHVDSDGFLFLTDRKHFTIISGGVNIYPSEIEAALTEDAAVLDCAVFGIPHPDMGEAVAAIIETDETNDPHDRALAEKIVARLDGKIAKHKWPRFILFSNVDRSETGKLRKQDLRDRYNRDIRKMDMREPSPEGALG